MEAREELASGRSASLLMIRRNIVIVLMSVAALGHRGLVLAETTASPTQAEVEKRIARVTNGLLPDTAFENRYGPQASLKERMAFHHTPGLSIAVVNNHQIEWARGFGVKEQGCL